MAEVTGLRNNALPYPIYGVPFGVTFPMLDADGDLVTGATTPDAERSLNGDTFADCTNESTEIATNSGVYYLLLTGAEMTADVVTVIAKSATAGMKTTVLTLYPRKLVSLRTGTSQAGAAGTITLDASASAIDDYYNGCVCVAVIDSNTEARVISDYVGSTKVASVPVNWNVNPDSDDTFTIYLPESRQIPQSDNVGWLGVAIAAADTAGYPKVTIKDGTGTGEIDTTSGGVLVAAIAANAITATSINAGAITNAKFAANAIDATAIADGAIDAATLAADTITAAKVHADVTTEFNAPILAVLGALNDAAADGAVTTTDTMVAYLKQLINTLEGAPGIPTWPASAAPANGVSIAEGLRYVYDQIGAAGAGLTAIDLPDQTMNITGNVTGNLSGSVGSVTGAVGSVTGLTAATVHADLDDIQARLPAALTANGNIKADTLRVGGTLQTAGDLSAQIDAVDNFVDAEVAAIKTVVDAVQAKTDNLPSDPADASVIAARFDTLDTSVADLPTNAELATALGTADDAVLTAIDALPTNAELATALGTADDAVLAAIATLQTYVDTEVAAIPTALQNADALLDRIAGVETGLTPRQAFRLFAAALLGKASGLETTTAVYRDTGDSKDRITATVDVDGNRSVVTLDAS